MKQPPNLLATMPIRLPEEDKEGLRQAANELGLISISSLIRMIIKDYLTVRAAKANRTAAEDRKAANA